MPSIIAEGTCVHCNGNIVLKESLTTRAHVVQVWEIDPINDPLAHDNKTDCPERPYWAPTNEDDPDGPQDVRGYEGHEPKEGWNYVDLPE